MPCQLVRSSDTLVESEEDTLRFRTAQTRRSVSPKPLPDAVSSVAVVVADRFNGNEAASSTDVKQCWQLTPLIGSP